MPDEDAIIPDPAPSPPSKFGDTQSALALFLVCSFVGVIVLLIFHPVPSDTQAGAVLYPLLGTLGTMAVGVGTYYFGSSKGSDNKSASAQSTLKTLVDKVVQNGDGHPEPPKPAT